MASSNKYEDTRKWVAEAGSGSPGNATNQDLNAVITIQTGPEEASSFSLRKFLVHMGYGNLLPNFPLPP